jgi:hypothetical protein
MAAPRPNRHPVADMGKTVMGAWSFEGSDDQVRTTKASADFMLGHYHGMAANVIGRRLFDMTNGWNGKPALVPVVFGSGRPFFATGPLAEPLRLENPSEIVRGDRVTHLVYDIRR